MLKKKNVTKEYTVQALISRIVAMYEESKSINKVVSALQSDGIKTSYQKVRKILVTAGVLEDKICREIAVLQKDGFSSDDICQKLGISKVTLNSYTPYKKGPYYMGGREVKESGCYQEKSFINRYGDERLSVSAITVENLWQVIQNCQGEIFYTKKGLPFTYIVKGGELFAERRKKSITRSTFEKAFQKILDSPEVVVGPKSLNVYGAPYIWAVFIKLGIVNR